MRTQTLKGFKDYLPEEARRREFVVGKIVKVFQKFGFDPLETPTLEYADVLEGKYGEEEKLIYKFETLGGDRVAMKYDLTVPLARVVAQYGPRGEQVLPIPFKRYQIQSAFRGENTQKGRYREFLQCDVDIVGVDTAMVDAEVLAVAFEVYKSLGLEVGVKINDRSLLMTYEPKLLSAVDKLKKVGETGVMSELTQKGYPFEYAKSRFEEIKNKQITPRLERVRELFGKMGYPLESLEFESTLVRGLDYYTGLIFEVVLKSDPNSASLAGGGRWDKMIGKFTDLDLPAVGFSVGLDRTIEALEEAGKLDVGASSTKVLVSVFSPELMDESLRVALRLRSGNNKEPGNIDGTEGVNTEVWLDAEVKLDKQLKYADEKGIPYAVIVGPDEVKSNQVVLKNLKERTQESLTVEELNEKLRITRDPSLDASG